MTRGPTSAMMSPMIVMTTRISTRVKPRVWCPARRRRPVHRVSMLRSFIRTLPVSSDDLADRQKCGHHRDDKTADHDADGYDRQWAGNTDHPIEAALQLCLKELGYATGQ